MSQGLFSFRSADGARRAAQAGGSAPTEGVAPPDGLGDVSPSVGDSIPARDSRGVSALFRERHAELIRLAALVVGDRATAEDVVQDVFARLCARDLLPGAGGVAYVRAAVLNACRSTLRRRTIARRIGGAHDRLLDGATRDGVGSAEDEVILAEDRRQVLAALATLPVRRREVLVLRYWLGLSEAEIASTLAISPGTVKSSAARGLATLARKLGEEA
jgi:RNA polymerase sigma factor (sigma-70 family)